MDGKATLKVLFKEVLELIPEDEAQKLADGYRRGENIALVIGESSYGRNKKTAFAYSLTKDQGWRNLPEAVGEIQ